jgi:hypothetical protein
MRILLIAFLASISMPSMAMDKNGNFAVWGPGRHSCYSYSQARKAEKYDQYKYYIMGFLTAYNTLTPDTYQISGVDKFPDVLTWLDNYCDKKPMQGFEQAVSGYIVAHHGSRLSAPPTIYGR